MATTIVLRSPKDLAPAIRKLGREMDRAAVGAMRKTARWGAAEVLRISATTTPRPRAFGTYERSWVVTRLSDGAALSNSAKHAYFVEVGRQPGRQPPTAPIVEWMIAKRLDKRLARAAGRDGRGRFKSLSRKRLESIAYLIARKIGRDGTKGTRVLERAVPGMRRRLRLELAIAMRAAFDKG